MNVLFNNAGVGGGFDWDTTIAINLSGVFYGLRYGADYLARNGGGVIINTASIAGLVGLVGPHMASIEELEPGFMAVAVPVHARDGQVVAAVGIGGPRVRLDPERLAAIAKTLPSHAARISERLGSRPLSPAAHRSKEERR